MFSAYFYTLAGGIGLGAGNHRFWSHRAFKANVPYKIMVSLMALSSYQVFYEEKFYMTLFKYWKQRTLKK